MENETQNETVLAHELCPGDAYETNEQKTKRRVPSYYLIHDHIANPCSCNFHKFESKKDLRDFLETNHAEELNPNVTLGHEVTLTFNKVVKVDF